MYYLIIGYVSNISTTQQKQNVESEQIPKCFINPHRTKNFTSYPTIEKCLDAGGRLPKRYSSASNSNSLAGKGYERKYFGHGWDDEDGDCQNTRHEILIAQNVGNITFTDSKKCAVRGCVATISIATNAPISGRNYAASA